MYLLCAVGVYFYPGSIQVIRRTLKEQKERMDLDLFGFLPFSSMKVGFMR